MHGDLPSEPRKMILPLYTVVSEWVLEAVVSSLTLDLLFGSVFCFFRVVIFKNHFFLKKGNTYLWHFSGALNC